MLNFRGHEEDSVFIRYLTYFLARKVANNGAKSLSYLKFGLDGIGTMGKRKWRNTTKSISKQSVAIFMVEERRMDETIKFPSNQPTFLA